MELGVGRDEILRPVSNPDPALGREWKGLVPEAASLPSHTFVRHEWSDRSGIQACSC